MKPLPILIKLLSVSAVVVLINVKGAVVASTISPPEKLKVAANLVNPALASQSTLHGATLVPAASASPISSPPQSLASSNSAQVSLQKRTEAEAFFTDVIQHSNNPVISEMARQSLKALNSFSSSSSETSKRLLSETTIRVPLIRHGNTSLGVLTTLNNQIQGTFIIDTGATYTVITPALAKKLNILPKENAEYITLLTANGSVQAPIVTVPSVKIGAFEVKNVQAIVQPLGHNTEMFGLLGLNFFNGLNFSFTQNALILEPQPTLGIHAINSGYGVTSSFSF